MEIPFEIEPLPLEQEFKVKSVSHRLHELTREELEMLLSEALMLVSQLAHQLRQIRDYVESQ